MKALEASISDGDLAAFNLCVDAIVSAPANGAKAVCCIV